MTLEEHDRACKPWTLPQRVPTRTNPRFAKRLPPSPQTRRKRRRSRFMPSVAPWGPARTTGSRVTAVFFGRCTGGVKPVETASETKKAKVIACLSR